MKNIAVASTITVASNSSLILEFPNLIKVFTLGVGFHFRCWIFIGGFVKFTCIPLVANSSPRGPRGIKKCSEKNNAKHFPATQSGVREGLLRRGDVSGSMQPSHKVRETHTFSSSQEERRTFGSRVDSLPHSTFLFSDSVFGMREWEREGAQLCRVALLL